jgi:xanthine dehydrogenase iron-sulfur cluster and FAD-binding subunit A
MMIDVFSFFFSAVHSRNSIAMSIGGELVRCLGYQCTSSTLPTTAVYEPGFANNNDPQTRDRDFQMNFLINATTQSPVKKMI